MPGEHSSGATRRQTGITKTGDRWVRTLLLQAAWSYRYRAKVSPIIEKRAQDIDPRIRSIAWDAQRRLTRKYQRTKARRKQHNVIVTAIARELAGFLWAAARLVPQAR